MSDSEIQKESILKGEIKAKITFLSFFFTRFLYKSAREKKITKRRGNENNGKVLVKPRGANEIMTNFH